jgi:membrane-bound inhibitor of C-type lysozyme
MVTPKAIQEQGVAVRARAGCAAALAAGLAMGLVGCGDPPAASRRAELPPNQQGPVNPDVRVTVYACVDGQTIVAGYPDRDTAVVTYKNHAYTLKRAPSANGVRYTGYGLQWRTKGTHGQIATLAPGEEAASAPGIDCKAASDQPVSGAPTRTNFTLLESDSSRRH